MFDAIVVGARCAGAATAMLLARQGYRLLLVDRATFPSDQRQSTLLIHQPGVALLDSWGLLDRVRASGSPPITRWFVDMGPLVFRGTPVAAGQTTEAFAPRRTVLDKLLVDFAAQAGADVQEGFAVEEILADDGRVVGIRGRDRQGRTRTEKARLVIGADGHRSAVVQAVKPAEYWRRDSKICTWYTYWRDVALRDGTDLEFYPREYRGVYAWPTNDGQLLIGVNWPVSDFDRVREQPERHYLETLAECAPDLAGRVRDGVRGDDFVGGYAANVFRKPYGPGWALVGDAGATYEFTSAHGITNAFRQAAFLADAAAEGLSGRRDMDEALAVFEARRNDAELEYYDFTYQQASLEPPPPSTVALFGAIHRSQSATDAFLGVFAQTVRPSVFFSSISLSTIAGQPPS
jgi:flavin-dependent dehydrogenase